MKTRKAGADRLKTLLTDAYRAREDLEVDERWQERLMARIGQIGPLTAKPGFTAAFGRFVWRLAPFTLVLSVALVFLLAGLYVTTRYDGLQLTARDVEELTLEQALGG
jgi:hypothetical protein